MVRTTIGAEAIPRTWRTAPQNRARAAQPSLAAQLSRHRHARPPSLWPARVSRALDLVPLSLPLFDDAFQRDAFQPTRLMRAVDRTLCAARFCHA